MAADVARGTHCLEESIPCHRQRGWQKRELFPIRKFHRVNCPVSVRGEPRGGLLPRADLSVSILRAAVGPFVRHFVSMPHDLSLLPVRMAPLDCFTVGVLDTRNGNTPPDLIPEILKRCLQGLSAAETNGDEYTPDELVSWTRTVLGRCQQNLFRICGSE